MNTIAERLLLLRGKNKQGDFAKALEINPNTLRNYESGRVLPNQEILERICVQFSVSPEWLLLGRGPMHGAQEAKLTPPCAPCSPTGTPCEHCARLEKKLEHAEEERRQLTTEVRLMTTENRNLWKENGELREKYARLEERQRQRPRQGDGEPVGHTG